jgi:hypothetical protein
MKNIAILFSVLIISCNSASNTSKIVSAKETKNTNDCWTDFRIGELPPMGYYDGIDSLVKKWSLCYTRIEGGCVIDDSTETLSKKYEIENKKYFKQLESKFGKDWKHKFDKELHILDSINWLKINATNNHLNKK